MAKKKKVVEPTKPKTSDAFIFASYGICAVIMAGLLMYAVGVFDKEFKPEIGQCYITRDYTPVKITMVLSALKEVGFRPMQVLELGNLGWYLGENKTQFGGWRKFEFVQANWVKVECDNLFVRKND